MFELTLASSSNSKTTEEPTTTGSTLATQSFSSNALLTTEYKIEEDESSATMSEVIVEKPNTTSITAEALTTISLIEDIEPLNTISLGQFKLTAYCPCSKCCGKWAGGITSTGVTAQANHTIAVDPTVIPYGSKVCINGQLYFAEDCGGAIKENHLDIYFDTHQEASDFGVRYAEVYLVVE